MRAELHAAALGLELAWDLGLRKVNMKLDSKAAIAAIDGDPESTSWHSRILHKIRDLRNRDWVVLFTHTFREGNRVADLLAHEGHSLAFGLFFADCNSDIWFIFFS
ncbi:Putative ribonuclease H protein At1g65750 [Linum perenne]